MNIFEFLYSRTFQIANMILSLPRSRHVLSFCSGFMKTSLNSTQVFIQGGISDFPNIRGRGIRHERGNLFSTIFFNTNLAKKIFTNFVGKKNI